MKKIFLIMRNQKNSPKYVLNESDIFPDEYLWGYRPLCNIFGTDHTGIFYTGANNTFNNILLRVFSHVVTKLMGDMKIIPSLAIELWRQQRKIESVFVTANSAIITTLIVKKLGLGFRVYPLLLGWPEFKFSQMNWLTFRVWRFLLRQSDGILALGIEEVQELKLLGLNNVQHLNFGIDTNFWKPLSVKNKDYIFSVGADPNRDFETLLAASLNIPILLCAPVERIRCLSVPKNVNVVQGSYLDVQKWFREAKVVVIPIKDTIRPSGQGCILQAMATGKAVVTTRTQGRWTDKLIHGENCILTPPGDAEALKQAIYSVYNDSTLTAKIGKNARKTVLDHFAVGNFVRSLMTVTGLKQYYH